MTSKEVLVGQSAPSAHLVVRGVEKRFGGVHALRGADFEVAGVDNYDLAIWIQDNLNFDQLILECYDQAKGPNSGWVHVSFVGQPENRMDVLTYDRSNGYRKGLIF